MPSYYCSVSFPDWLGTFARPRSQDNPCRRRNGFFCLLSAWTYNRPCIPHGKPSSDAIEFAKWSLLANNSHIFRNRTFGPPIGPNTCRSLGPLLPILVMKWGGVGSAIPRFPTILRLSKGSLHHTIFLLYVFFPAVVCSSTLLGGPMITPRKDFQYACWPCDETNEPCFVFPPLI